MPIHYGQLLRQHGWLGNGVSVVLALLLVYMITMALSAVSDVTAEPPTQLSVRKIEVGLPPPPPPPPEPRSHTEAYDPAIAINLAGDHGGPSVGFSSRPKLANITINELPKPAAYKMDIGADIEKRVRSFKVEQLDEQPRIVRSRQSRIPSKLRREGIRTVEAQVDILIDTKGKAHIRRLVDAGYPEMIPVIQAHIEALEFTIPKKDGQPVNGEYLFTIRFKELL